MARGRWDKTGISAGDPVTDWKLVHGSDSFGLLEYVDIADALSQPVLRFRNDADDTDRTVALFNPAGNSDKWELVFRFQQSELNTASGDRAIQAACFIVDSTDPTTDGFARVQIFPDDAISARTEYPSELIGSASLPEPAQANRWEWMRVRIEPVAGGLHRHRATWWTGGESDEPIDAAGDPDWILDVEGAFPIGISEVGYPGLHVRIAGPTHIIDYYGWGSDGDTAPLPSEFIDDTLSNATGSATGDSTAGGSVDTGTGEGSLFWVVSENTEQPTSSQIKAGEDASGIAVDSGSQTVSNTGTQNVSASGLAPATTYRFFFTQDDAAGENLGVIGSNTFTTGGSAPTDPVNVTAAQEDVDVIITWEHDGSNLDGFRIERSADGGSFTQIATPSASDRTYADIQPGFAYYEYRVIAIGGGAESDPAVAEVTVLPVIPESVETHIWIFAHFDDEILTAGGSMAMLKDDGRHHVGVVMTDGRASNACSIVDGDCFDARQKEYRAAVGIMDMTDIRLYKEPEASLTVSQVSDAINQLIEEFSGREKVIWHGHSPKDNYGPYIPNGHPDHDAVADALTEAYESGKIKHLRHYRIAGLTDNGETAGAIQRFIADDEFAFVVAALAEYRLSKPAVGRYAVAQESVPTKLTAREDQSIPEYIDLPDTTLGALQESERTITVTRDGNTVDGADVIFISKRLLKEATLQSAVTTASGEVHVIVPKQTDMVGIILEGDDGKVREIREDT